MEQKHSWHKFQKMIGFLPSKKRGLSILSFNNKIYGGAISGKKRELLNQFDDFGLPAGDKESLWEVLEHKYQVDGISFIERNEILASLHDISILKTGKTNSYYTQLSQLRGAIGVDGGEKIKGVCHKGERSVASFWPKEHFILSFFDSTFADLLPERKILLLSIYDHENKSHDVLALEFTGRELKEFYSPDWSNLEWTKNNFDTFHLETAHRIVLWSENTYMLPTYAIFVSKRLWQECLELQINEGPKKAWSYFTQQSVQRDNEKELLVEPTPWPITAALRWHSMRG